jgi:hypothetical protein
MTGDKDIFLTLRKERDGSVSFRNDDLAKIIGKGTIIIRNKNTKGKNVLLVEDMKHDLLSVIQMCDQGHKVNLEEWVTYTLITLSKSAKRKHLEKFPELQNQPTLYASIVKKESKQRLGLNKKNIQQ